MVGSDSRCVGDILMRPVRRDGGVIGFRFDGLRPKSVFALCGARNGDVWVTSNGRSMASPDEAVKAHESLRHAPFVDLGVDRAGQPITFRIDLD
jgi:general secretion pathway protein C